MVTQNKKTFEQFNLLLRQVLNDDALIQQWDAVFGNRFINNLAFEKLLLAGFISKKSVWRAFWRRTGLK